MHSYRLSEVQIPSERKLIKGLHEPSLEYGITVSRSLPKNMTSNRVSSVDPANKSPF